MTPAELIHFEAAHPGNNSDKETTLRARGIAPARYYMLLHRAAYTVEGITADPVTARMVRDRAVRGAERRQKRIAA